MDKLADQLSEFFIDAYQYARSGIGYGDYLPDDQLPDFLSNDQFPDTVEPQTATPAKRCNQQSPVSKSTVQGSSESAKLLLQQENEDLEKGLIELLKPYSPAVTPELRQKMKELTNAAVCFCKITDFLNPEKRKWSGEKTRIKEELIEGYLSKNSQFHFHLVDKKYDIKEYNILKSHDEMVRKIIGDSSKREKCAFIRIYRPNVDPTALQDEDFNELHKKCVEESKLPQRLQTLINFFIDFSKTTSESCQRERFQYKKNQLSFLIKCLHFDLRILTPNAKNELFSLIKLGKLEVSNLNLAERKSLCPLIDIILWEGGTIDFSQKKKLEEREQLSRDIGCPGIPFSELDEPAKEFYKLLLEAQVDKDILFSCLDEYQKNQFVSLLKCCGVTGDLLTKLPKEVCNRFDQYAEINKIPQNANNQLSKLVYTVTENHLHQSINEEIGCEDVVTVESVILDGEFSRYKISCLRFPSAYSIFLLLSDKKIGAIPDFSKYNGEKEFIINREQLDALIQFLTASKETIARYHDVMLDILGSQDYLSQGTKTVAEVRNDQNKKKEQEQRITSSVLSGLPRDTKTPILLYTACSLDLTAHADKDLIKRMQKGVYRIGGLQAFNGRIKEFQRDKPYVSNLNLKDLQAIEPLMNRIVVLINACIRNLGSSTLTEGVSLLQACDMTLLESMKTYQVQKIGDLLQAIGIEGENKQTLINHMDTSLSNFIRSMMTFDENLDQLRAPPGSDKRDPAIVGGISTDLLTDLSTVFGVEDLTIRNLVDTLSAKGFLDGTRSDVLKNNLNILIGFLKENAKLGDRQLPLRGFPLFIEYVRDSHKYCTLEDLKDLVEEFRLDWLEKVSHYQLNWVVQTYTQVHFVPPVQRYEPSSQDILGLYETTQRCVRPNLTKPTINALFKTLKELSAVQALVGRTPTVKMALDALEEVFYNRITSFHYLEQGISTSVYYSRDLVHQGFEYIETLVAKIKHRDKSKVTDESIEEAFIELIALCSDGDLVNSCAQGFSGRLQSMLLRLNQASESNLSEALNNFKKECADSAFTNTLLAFGQNGRNENSMFLPLKNDLYINCGLASATQANTIRATGYHGDFSQKAMTEFLRQYNSQTVYRQAFTFVCNRFKECNALASEDPEKDKEIYKLLKLLGFGDKEELLDKEYRINGNREFRWQFALFEDKLPSKLVPYLITTKVLANRR